MNLLLKSTFRSSCAATLCVISACGLAKGIDESENALIDPPVECSATRPDCSVSTDFPDQADLNPTNSSGVRFSPASNALVIDRVTALPDEDLDGVPDDADDCLGQPGWRMPCDGDASDDGIFQTLFFDDSGSQSAVRISAIPRTVNIPAVDLYFLVDGTASMSGVISVLQSEIGNIISDVELLFDDPRYGVGLARDYSVVPVAAAESQAPYHHVLDLTDDTTLFSKAVSTLDAIDGNDNTRPEAVGQALYPIASGQGLGDSVPNRSPCPPDQVGYPCFRPDVLRVVLAITDAEMYNGPRPESPLYPPFNPTGTGGPAMLPPVEMFPALFDANDAASALDLGDLSSRSLTLMGMSTLLSDEVNTVANVGCQSPPVMPGGPMDGKDAVITFQFDTPPAMPFSVSANNTQWPGAVLSLFDDAALDPLASLLCEGMGTWNAIAWPAVASQQYYLVVDGQIVDMTSNPEGAFSVAIEHDGDPANPAWLTHASPIDWAPIETALLANNIRVASVVSPFDSMTMPSEADADVRAVANITGAVTKTGGEWVGEITTPSGDGLGAAISNTIALIVDESVYDLRMVAVDDDATPMFDELEFVTDLRPSDCAEGQAFECSGPGGAMGDECLDCEPGADIEFELEMLNSTVPPTAGFQVFDFEVVVTLEDGVIEFERIPVRVLVPDAASHEFEATPGANFYRNSYDSFDRCVAPSERPDWSSLTWTGSTPGGSSIEFQIRSANTQAELALAVPVIVTIPFDTTSPVLDVGQELVASGTPNGLPFVGITAILHPSPDLLATPELTGWQLVFTCFPAD